MVVEKTILKQLQKYTPENLARYAAHTTWIAEQDLDKLIYMDEVHVVSKGMCVCSDGVLLTRVLDVSQQRALAPTGDKVILLRGEHFGKTYSVSVLCSLGEDPLFLAAREDSNDQYDFFSFIVQALASGYLKPGHILVLDMRCMAAWILLVCISYPTSLFFPLLFPLLSVCPSHHPVYYY